MAAPTELILILCRIGDTRLMCPLAICSMLLFEGRHGFDGRPDRADFDFAKIGGTELLFHSICLILLLKGDLKLLVALRELVLISILILRRIGGTELLFHSICLILLLRGDLKLLAALRELVLISILILRRIGGTELLFHSIC